jgi:DNA-binding transcriptional ArsR family regulator
MLAALGQPARLEIFRLLVRAGPAGSCVDDIRRRVRMPGSTLSHHLDTLSRCGLLAARRDGRFIYYAIDWKRTAGLIQFVTQDCCADLHTTFAPCPVPAGATSAARRAGATRPTRGSAAKARRRHAVKQ